MSVKNQQLIGGYLEYLSANKNLSKNTIKSYKDDLVEFASFSGKKDIDLTKTDDVKKFINYLSIKFSPKSHSRKLSSLKNFLIIFLI